jgi:hypothetical protein
VRPEDGHLPSRRHPQRLAPFSAEFVFMGAIRAKKTKSATSLGRIRRWGGLWFVVDRLIALRLRRLPVDIVLGRPVPVAAGLRCLSRAR